MQADGEEAIGFRAPVSASPLWSRCAKRACLLRVISGLSSQHPCMSALLPKADISAPGRQGDFMSTRPSSFLAAFPRYSAEEQMENLRVEREALVANIDRRLQTGKFDLSCLPEQDPCCAALCRA